MNHHDYDKTIFCPLQTNTVFSRNDLNKRVFLAMRTLYQRSQGSPSSYNLRHREPGATLGKNCGSFTFGAAKCCFTTDERGYQPCLGRRKSRWEKPPLLPDRKKSLFRKSSRGFLHNILSRIFATTFHIFFLYRNFVLRNNI